MVWGLGVNRTHLCDTPLGLAAISPVVARYASAPPPPHTHTRTLSAAVAARA